MLANSLNVAVVSVRPEDEVPQQTEAQFTVYSLQFIERIQAGYVDISNKKLDSYAELRVW